MDEQTTKLGRSEQATLLKSLAINWPDMVRGFPAEMVRAALFAGAAMLDGTASRRKPFDVLAEDFGLNMSRFAGDKQVRVIGVRTVGGPRRDIWEVRVMREALLQACVQKDDEPVLTIYADHGVSPCQLERIAVKSLLTLVSEKKRCTRNERKRRAKAREVKA